MAPLRSAATPAGRPLQSDPAGDCPKGKANLYEVGPGKRHTSIGSVPWESLGPGDTVKIHYRAEPYREKILLSQSGTAEQPIRVCGVRGPKGELPVLAGRGATTRAESKYPYPPTQERGLIIITPRQGYRWGQKPSHILIQDLEVREAYPGTDASPHTFVDFAGTTRTFNRNGASIFIERGEHITIRGCTLTDSAYGLFVASGGSEEVISREILVEHNYIYGNGIADTDRRHNVYSEAMGIVFQGNRFGPQRPGAKGNQLKDRSAGTVIRYNWIEGGAHLMDLVEPEESVDLTIKDPRYHGTFVYGNVMVSGPNDGSSLIHYGGDNGKTSTYRKGTLYFFHNTVVILADEGQRWNTTLLRLETADERADVRNNVIFRAGTTHVSLVKKTGQVRLGTNWISNGFDVLQYADKGEARVEGLDQVISGPRQGSPFVDAPSGDFRPAPKSAILAAGGPLATDLPVEHRPNLQYLVHQGLAPRKTWGPGASLGAFE